MNIILLGLRASGKSTVGRLLAAHLGVPLYDLDDLAPRLLGCHSVAEAWANCGQQAFRHAEVQALQHIIQTEASYIVALGGGTPTAPGAVSLLGAARAVLIYLAAPAPILRQRMQADRSPDRSPHGDPDRPSLTGADPLDEIDAILAQRDPLYKDLARHTVDAAPPPDIVAREILRLLQLP